MVEARQEGLAEGFSRGLSKGLVEGLSKLTEAARRMKRDGLAAGQIAAYTGLSPEEIERL
jgi:predicted transposase YdaD